ncbi:hypothetical protein [Nostoc sp.]|uniref:hypothetical protein n=1 Tax=Nostoc sp. TaxID=1180 RepID=UPI002FFA5204
MSNVRRTSVFASIVLSSLLIYSFPAQSQQRVCVITDEGATVCGKPTKQPKNTNSHSEQRKLINGYVFLLKGCRRSDTTIKCNLLITRESTEDNFGIDASKLTIVDSVGKSYNGSAVEMGGKSGNSVSLRISPGINYVTDITFENIPENITQAPVLKLPVFANNGANNIEFRNVPFLN